MRITDCANREVIFRTNQPVPYPNAEPFELWYTRLAEERIQEIIDSSPAIERERRNIERKLGKLVLTSKSAKDFRK